MRALRTGAPTASAAAALYLLLSGCGDAPGSADDPRPSAPAMTSGEVWSVGLDDFGQLGREAGDFDVALGPVRAPSGQGTLSDVKQLAAGEKHSLALTTDGRVLAWGANSNGQLGNGTGKPSFVPVPVHAPDGREGELRGVTRIEAQGNISIALLADGRVVTWGAGGSGQRGIGSATSPAYPTTVRSPDGGGPLTGVTTIAAGDQACLVTLGDGRVLAWGGNRAGILGVHSVQARALPAPVSGVGGQGRLTGVVWLAAGNKHAIALTKDGRVLLAGGSALTWGADGKGQLGAGSRLPRPRPGPLILAQGTRAGAYLSASAGGHHLLALMRSRDAQ